jgi:hypothetical protein
MGKYTNERYLPSEEKSVLKNCNLEETDLLVSQKAVITNTVHVTELRTLHKGKDLLVSVCHLIRETSGMSLADVKGNAIRLSMFSQTSMEL